MIKLKNLLNENKGLGILFTKEADYKSFKKFVKEESINVIIKDMGKSKYSSDTGGWYISVDHTKMVDEWGYGYEKELKKDWPSMVVS